MFKKLTLVDKISIVVDLYFSNRKIRLIIYSHKIIYGLSTKLHQIKKFSFVQFIIDRAGLYEEIFSK